MNILAIGAHPDDIEYGCGGFLSLCADKGHEVNLFVATDGSVTKGANRVAEQEQAAELLGAKGLFWGGFEDTALAPGRKLIVAVEDVIARTSPDMVLVNSPHDAHQDHQAIAGCTITACRYVRSVLFYHDYTTLGFEPNTFVNIAAVLDWKRGLLACHASQVSKTNPTGLDLLESVNALATYYGFVAKVKYAEGFCSLRNLIEP